MEKINWKQKLTSRKFWAAIITVVTTTLVAFNVSNLTIEQVVAVIAAASVLIAYIVGEGLVDAARLKSEGEKAIAQNTYALMRLDTESLIKWSEPSVQNNYISNPLSASEIYNKTKDSMDSISPNDTRGI